MVDSSRSPRLCTSRLGEPCDSHSQDTPVPFALGPKALPADAPQVRYRLGLEAAVDWNSIAPHPDLELLEQRCHCGAPRGEHLTTGDQRAERWPCNGWRPSTVDASKAGAK